MKEEWRHIPGYEEKYQASNLGRVRSLDKVMYVKSPRSRDYTKKIKGKVLTPQKTTLEKYLHVSLYKTPGKNTTRLVHDLILSAFVFVRPSPHMECAHADGNPTNNTISNLRWATSLENANDRRKHGTSGQGVQNSRAKLCDKKVEAIRLLIGLYTFKQLGSFFGVGPQAISKIAAGTRWKI